MISASDQLIQGGTSLKPLSPRLKDVLRVNGRRYVADLAAWMAESPNLLRPSEWLEESEIYLEIDATRGRERFAKRWTFVGREYLREPIDLIDEPDRLFLTLCGGTGIGKTLRDYGIFLHEIYHNPFSGLYVMPAATGSGSASEISHELIAILDASPVFAGRLPVGVARKVGLTRTRIEFGGNNIWFVGGHSTSKLGGKRCRIVAIGEMDKTKEQMGREASADYLAGERTKNMTNSLVLRGSSPSAEGVGIWRALMGGGESSGSDCRRRFLPCPHCNTECRRASLKGWFVLIKDDQYNTALPSKLPDGKEIPFAKMRWDAEAKRRDGSWDMDRVISSARFECPHCGGHCRDEHRLWMDRNGRWIATRLGEKGHFGHQLSSYYAPLMRDEFGQLDFKSTWGGMAQKFLNAIENGSIGGYINSDLAEVNAGQQYAGGNVIDVSPDVSRPDSVLWLPFIGIDRQQNYPGFWFVVRQFIASILRPARNLEQQKEFLAGLNGELKTVSERLVGSLELPKEVPLYSPHWILSNLQRTDHWPALADWLVVNGLTGKRLCEFFSTEFQSDLIRFLEFICRQREVNISLGKQGDSEALEVGSADSWEELDELQQQHKVQNQNICVDARFGSMDNAEVFAECFRRCPPNGFIWYTPLLQGGRFFKEKYPGGRPFALHGWCPVMGFPQNKVWPGKDRIRLPYGMVVDDPFKGKMEARQFYQYVFQFDAQWALSELARIRKRNSWTLKSGIKFSGFNSQMRPVNLDEYNRHMKGYFWNERELRWEAPGKTGGSQSRQHPNHLYDCEKNILARAIWRGIFKYERTGSQAALSEKPVIALGATEQKGIA